MQQGWSRRGFLQAAGVTGLLAACSEPKPAPGSAGGGSVRVTHLFGQTVVKEPPKRVV
ncbi:MAG: twin-arginine translocation signal domain-containing protein, partial [Mycobacteriaceae bacterium]|nr:twin-arginine translocation signal domain-containing protein [Mycobacteriaceae bacterium]